MRPILLCAFANICHFLIKIICYNNLNMSRLKSYENILVSAVDYNFSQNPHENIPQQLFADWINLVSELAKFIQPTFNIPSFPRSFKFETESIPSDGPYSSSANYYMLDFVYYKLIGETDGIMISFEDGRQGGGNSVSVETLQFETHSSAFYPNYLVSSHILKSATSPLATFYISHDETKKAEIKSIFARHREDCVSNKTK